MLKVGAVSFGSYNPDENKVLPPKLKPKPQYEIKAGDVLIGRANVLRLVGACAYVEETRSRLMMCDKIFRVIFPEASELDGRYLAEVMKLPRLRRQIEMMATGSSPTMKNISKESLLDLRLPLPAIDLQRDIVRRVRERRQVICSSLTQASAKTREAKKEIEAMILGKSDGKLHV